MKDIIHTDDLFLCKIPEGSRALDWALFGGGFLDPVAILNQTVSHQDLTREDLKHQFLENCERYAIPSDRAVGLFTSVPQKYMARTTIRFGPDRKLKLRCFATVGLGNAIRAGESAEFDESLGYGTINILVMFNGILTDQAFVESVAIATEAKTAALNKLGIKSVLRDSELATGTGTDCIVIVSTAEDERVISMAGKQTKFGESLGRVVFRSVTKGVLKNPSSEQHLQNS